MWPETHSVSLGLDGEETRKSTRLELTVLEMSNEPLEGLMKRAVLFSTALHALRRIITKSLSASKLPL